MIHSPQSAARDAAMVEWLARWERVLVSCQRARPARWRVRGLSDGEVRDALTLALLEARRAEPARVAHAADDERWAFDVIARAHQELRRAFRVDVTPMEFDDAPLLTRPATQEERCLEAEADELRAVAQARAESELSRPQRRWLEAMKAAAAAGEFFDASHELNLSAASRRLGKHRSSAQRAYEELKIRFGQELEQLE